MDVTDCFRFLRLGYLQLMSIKFCVKRQGKSSIIKLYKSMIHYASTFRVMLLYLVFINKISYYSVNILIRHGVTLGKPSL